MKKGRLRIKTKLYFLIIFSLITALTISVISNSIYQKTIQNYQNALNNQISLTEFFSSNHKLHSLYKNYILEPTIDNRSSFDGEMGYAKAQLNSLIQTTPSSSIQDEIKDLRNMFLTFEEAASQLISQIGILSKSELAKQLEEVLYINSLIDYTYKKHTTSMAVSLSNELSLLIESMKQNQKIYISIMVLGSVFISIVGYFIINQIIKPVVKISESAVALSKQKFDIPDVNLKTHDELAELADAFNIMKKSINKYILELNEHALLQEAYLKTLQTQINSHFLFNTLNIISRTAYFEGAPQTIQLLDATTDILRYSLYQSKKAVSIFDEISFAETYILIQKMRFSDHLSFHLAIDDELNDILVPPFIIQPLIENAIIHGGYNKLSHCTILTTVHQFEDRILIIVEDDGCGADPQTLDNIFNTPTSSIGGIGLHNLKERLQLFYQQDNMLKINSKKNEFFRVEITIRKEQYLWNTES